MAKLGRPFVYQDGEDRPVTMSFRIPHALAQRLKDYATRHRQSSTALVIEGLEWRLDHAPVSRQDARSNIQYYDNTISELREEMSARAMRDLLARVEAIEAALATRGHEAPALTADASESTRGDISHYDNNTVIQASAVEGDVPHEPIQPEDPGAVHEPPPLPPRVPLFDTRTRRLGKLCPAGHDYGGTGKSLLSIKGKYCVACNLQATQARRQRQRQPTTSTREQRPAGGAHAAIGAVQGEHC